MLLMVLPESWKYLLHVRSVRGPRPKARVKGIRTPWVPFQSCLCVRIGLYLQNIFYVRDMVVSRVRRISPWRVFAAVLPLCMGFAVLPAGAQMQSKFDSGDHNPLIDFWFCADPTSVEYDGRLYVYGTNDQQEFEANPRDSENSYSKIRSLTVFSTDDLVNWTFNGIIDMTKVASWLGTSWAPTIVSRVESDGKTHFYMYFLNSGYAVAVITATSPLGPWTSPLRGNLTNGFDPGAVIDEKGVGWLSYGGFGSTPSIVKLGSNMISLAGSPVPLNPPFHFEANELNYINGNYVYTYNTNWDSHSPWSGYSVPAPTTCSMCYMTSKTPEVSSSWKYGNEFFKNPGAYGYNYGNNHTHIQKYKDNYYLLYHTQMLQEQMGVKGGYRSISIDKIDVVESTGAIRQCTPTNQGIRVALQPLDPFVLQQAETTCATKNVTFKMDQQKRGNTYYAGTEGQTGMIKVSRVKLMDHADSLHLHVWGKGSIEVRINKENGKLYASAEVDSRQSTVVTVPVDQSFYGNPDLIFICKGAVNFDAWQFVPLQTSFVRNVVVGKPAGIAYDMQGRVVNPDSYEGVYIRDGIKYMDR